MENNETQEYLSLDEVRKIREEHGPLMEVEYYSSSSGMMAGSLERSSLHLYRQDARVLLEERDMDLYEPEVCHLYAVDEQLLAELQQLSERENLPAWSLLKVREEERIEILDYSSSASITLTYDDTELPAKRKIHRFIDREAVRHNGGSEVWKQIIDLLRQGIDPDKLLKSWEEPNPYSHFKKEDDEDEWQCPQCGTAGNTGAFCTQCGAKKPE